MLLCFVLMSVVWFACALLGLWFRCGVNILFCLLAGGVAVVVIGPAFCGVCCSDVAECCLLACCCGCERSVLLFWRFVGVLGGFGGGAGVNELGLGVVL